MQIEVIEERTLESAEKGQFRRLQLLKLIDGNYQVTQTAGKTGAKGRTKTLGEGLTLDRMRAKLQETERKLKVSGFIPVDEADHASENKAASLPPAAPVRLACGGVVTPVLF